MLQYAKPILQYALTGRLISILTSVISSRLCKPSVFWTAEGPAIITAHSRLIDESLLRPILFFKRVGLGPDPLRAGSLVRRPEATWHTAEPPLAGEGFAAWRISHRDIDFIEWADRFLVRGVCCVREVAKVEPELGMVDGAHCAPGRDFILVGNC